MKHDEQCLVEFIGDVLSDLKPVSLTYLADGFHSSAYRINDSHILRVANTEKAKKTYRFEQEILPQLQPYLATSVPQPHVYTTDELLLSIHPIIQGVPYVPCCEPNGKCPRQLLEQIAGFCIDLHKIDDFGNKISSYDFVATIKSDEIMTAADYLKLDQVKEEYDLFQNHAAITEKNDKVLVHADLNHSNIIVSTELGLLNGVIDFSELSYQIPEHEFSSLFKYDIKHALEIIEIYSVATGKRINIPYVFLCVRMRAYKLIAEAVRGSVINHDKIRHYQKRLFTTDEYTEIWR